eukprot:m.290821 g.290821  ORF g.290821 m.290821 type:complete len:402 (-) comp55084_c0_seq23:238-1443(-)
MSAESSAPTDADSCESSTESVPPPPQLLRLQSGTPGQTPARSAFDHLPPCRDHDRALHSAETVSVKVEPTEPLGAHSANASVHFRKPLQWAAADNSKFQKLNQGTLPSTHVQAAPPTARFILPFSAPMAPASCSYPSFVPALPAQNPALQIPFHQDLPPLVRCPFPLPLAHAAWPSVPPCGSFAGDLAFPLVPIQLATFPLFVTEPISAQSPTVLIPRRPVPPHSDSSLSSAAQEDAGLQHSENTSQTPPLRKGKTQTSGKQTLKIVRREFLDGSQRLYCCDLCSRRGMCRYSPGVIVHYSEAAPGTLEKLKLCDICGADYTDNTPRETSYYKCFRCSRLFSRADRLLAHAHHHTNLKPFGCRFCHRTFSRRARLSEHIDKFHPAELERNGVWDITESAVS